ncbi:Hypothetical protein BIBO2_0773 [Brucella sp. BO2]|nr:Hypothetical protein BIBO2_0773 [Brucella sp. BO2]
MSRRIAVQAGVFCAEQPGFQPVSACGEMHILPYLGACSMLFKPCG